MRSRYAARASSETRYEIFSRVCSTSRSSSVWQHSSGYVGVPFGDGPRSPTTISSRSMQMVLRSIRYWKASARVIGTEAAGAC